ncbi:MAG: SRPBCC family protein [Verrucomicrobiota bacterium]
MSKSVAITYPSGNAITVSREFDAPADLVFACHTKPQLVQRWMLGPPGWSMPVCEIALKVGDTYRYIWRNNADGSEFGFTGRFREVEVPTRVVHTESMIGQPGEALVTTIFTEHAGRTTLSVTMSFESPAMRDQVIATGMTDGMAMSYDKLDELLAEKVA